MSLGLCPPGALVQPLQMAFYEELVCPLPQLSRHVKVAGLRPPSIYVAGTPLRKPVFAAMNLPSLCLKHSKSNGLDWGPSHLGWAQPRPSPRCPEVNETPCLMAIIKETQG